LFSSLKFDARIDSAPGKVQSFARIIPQMTGLEWFLVGGSAGCETAGGWSIGKSPSPTLPASGRKWEGAKKRRDFGCSFLAAQSSLQTGARPVEAGFIPPRRICNMCRPSGALVCVAIFYQGLTTLLDAAALRLERAPGDLPDFNRGLAPCG